MRQASANFVLQNYTLKMKIIHISDTHGYHRWLTELPEADIIVHSGDFTMAGSEQEVLDFLNWFCDLPCKHKVFICGNHDDCLYESNIDGLDSNVYYLCNSGIEIEGLKFYGVPMFTEDCITNRQSQNYAQILNNTDVVITHSPAYGILDLADNIYYGSKELLQSLARINPRLHLFGHIHRQHGITIIGKTMFSNGAIMNEPYSTLNYLNIIEL